MRSIFVKNLDNLDCAYFDPELGIIGASWQLDVKVSGVLDENHFVIDFAILKKTIKDILKTTLDHALLVPQFAQNISLERESDTIRFTGKTRASTSEISLEKIWSYQGPATGIYPIDCAIINKEIILKELKDLILSRLSAYPHIDLVLFLHEENPSNPEQLFFSYTHGLPGHQGLCQRVFHGHRSSLEVYLDNERSPNSENYLIDSILGNSIHIASPQQCLLKDLPLGRRLSEVSQVELRYTGSYGEYYANIPGESLILVQDETSIECISKFLWQIIAKKNPGKTVKVVAYEGINKGSEFEGYSPLAT
ncbi:MAG: 6-carboxytetrahydropterin synthase [Oligoflexales bacterium]|nr:6-carboxytetrahydropterin synthase [Oligoflexales bacterium]